MRRRRTFSVFGMAFAIVIGVSLQAGIAHASNIAHFDGSPAQNLWTLDITYCQDGLTIQAVQTQLSTDNVPFSVQLTGITLTNSLQTLPLTVGLPAMIAGGNGTTLIANTATFLYAASQPTGTNITIEMQRWDHGETGQAAVNDHSGASNVITSTDQVGNCTIAPHISSVSPNTGPTSGGTQVLIQGTNLTNVSAVTFGGVLSPSFTSNPSGLLVTALSPPSNGPGTMDVRVITNIGVSMPTGADQFTYVAPTDTPTPTSTLTPTPTATNTASATSIPLQSTPTAISQPPTATNTSTQVPGAAPTLIPTNTPLSVATPSSSLSPTGTIGPAPLATAKITSKGGLLSALIPQTAHLGGARRLTVTVPTGALSQTSLFSVTLEPPALVPKSSTSLAAGAAFVLVATTGGQATHTFHHPLTLKLAYDPTGLSRAQQSKLVVAYFDPNSRTWINQRTTVNSNAHTLTAPVAHVTLFQPRLLTGAALRVAWPVTTRGKPAQGTIIGGRKQPCPSVAALQKVIAANTRHGVNDRFNPPYPTGCLWLPIQLSDAALVPQFAGARVTLTVAFPHATSVKLTTTLNSQGRSTVVLAVPSLPRSSDRVAGHTGPAAIATIQLVAIDKHGTPQPPASARFVVVNPPS